MSMSRIQRLWYLAGIFATMLLGVYFRTRNSVQIYLPNAVLGVDTDCYYHLRRAYLCARNFPRVPVFDPWLAWPRGASPTWGPGFDQLLAFPAWLLGGRDELAALGLIAAVPVCLGLLVIAAVAHLAWGIEHDPKQRAAVSLAAALVAASMPQAVHLSALGATDHHIIEALAPVLLLGWVIRIPETQREVFAWEARGAFLIAILSYIFPGTLLAHGLLGVALGLRFLTDRTAHRPDGALAFLGASLLLGAMAAGWTLQHGVIFHHLQLSALQPLLLAVAGSFLALLGLVPASGLSPLIQKLVRLCGACLGLSAIIGVTALFFPAWRHEIVAGFVDWLLTRDPWMASIEECAPLFSVRFPFLGFFVEVVGYSGIWWAVVAGLRASGGPEIDAFGWLVGPEDNFYRHHIVGSCSSRARSVAISSGAFGPDSCRDCAWDCRSCQFARIFALCGESFGGCCTGFLCGFSRTR